MTIKENATRIITWLVIAMTGMVVIILPLGFFFLSYQNMIGTLETEAEINADILTNVVSSNPDYWEFEYIRLTEYLSRRPENGTGEQRRIVNMKNDIVAENADDLKQPLIMRASEIRDSGIVVGKVEIYRSLQPLLKRTVLVFLLVLPLGLGTFYILRILPIKAIFLAETALIKTNDDLGRANILLHEQILKRQKVEDELHILNEELEARVLERTTQLEETNRDLEIQIGERKQIEKALIENEKKYRLVAEKMTDVVWILDMNLRTVYVSPSIESVLGFTPEERLVQDFDEQLTPASMLVVQDALAKEIAQERQGQLNSERTITIEAEYYHKDGSIRWIESIISGIRDDQGMLAGFHGVSRDITHRRQMEEDLRQSEKKYRELVDFIPISLFEIDLEGQVTSANPAIFETFGYTQIDFEKGLNGFQMIIPDDQERLSENIQRLFNGVWKGPSEYTGLRKDGTSFPFLIFPSPILRKGKPVGLRGAIIDLTDRKRMEESLRKSNLSLAEAQRIAHIGNWELDMERNTMYWSDEVHRILKNIPGTPDAALEDFLSFVFPEDREAVEKTFEKTIKEKMAAEIEHRISRHDGVLCEVRQLIEPIIDGSGRAVRIVGTIQDVTETKRVERELQNARDQLLQSEKLASMGRLSAGVAHEILNPVNIISLELQMLETMGNLPSEVLYELKICTDQINRIVDIAENLKQLSRIPEKKIVMANINDIIAHIMSLYATQLKIEGIDADVQYRPDLPEMALDKEKIEQVIMNLISNATAAMEGKEKKKLQIRTERITVSENDDQVKISIADTGTGIKSEHMQKIFDPFFTTKGQGKGTGLGLSISYGIIHDHGGTIWAVNNRWGGTTFHISIPVKTDA